MKYVRIPFNFQYLSSTGGIEAKLFSEMLSKLPPDSKILGFRCDMSTMVDYIFVESDMFEEVYQGNHPPTINVSFIKRPDGTGSCEDIDFGTAIRNHIHNWTLYTGLYESYTYCLTCGEKQ